MTLKTVVDVALALAAITAAGVLVRRELRPTTPAEPSVTYVENWKVLAAAGTRTVDTAPKIQITVFSDFECPACRAFDAALREFRTRHAGVVDYTFVHFPLPYHANAVRAANAVECAGAQGWFIAMQDVTFDNQTSLATVSFSQLATLAGVPDGAAFAQCLAAADTLPAVHRGLAAGRELVLKGTPTVLVNGWRFSRPPTMQQLDSAPKRQ